MNERRVQVQDLSGQIHGWEFIDLRSANVVGYTQDADERDEWLAEVKAGDWGDVGVSAIGPDGIAVEILWPREAS